MLKSVCNKMRSFFQSVSPGTAILIICCACLCLTSCNSCQGCDLRRYPIKATFYYVNQTSESIWSEEGCGFYINPADTLIYVEDEIFELQLRPSVDIYPLRFSTNNCIMTYDEEGKLCEYGIKDILNYENRKEVEDLIFEFTFRFTEEKKAVAEECL